MRTVGVGVNRPMFSKMASHGSPYGNKVGELLGIGLSWAGNHILGRLGFKEMDRRIINDIHSQSPNGKQELFEHKMRHFEWRSF